MGLDGRLDPVVLVAGDDDEAPGMRANALVLGRCELDEAIATEVRALTPEPDGIRVARPLSALDRFVDLAKACLVGGDPPLEIFMHGKVLPPTGAYLGRVVTIK